VVVAVAADTNKAPLFSLEQRVAMATVCWRMLANVEVRGYSGLTVNFARDNGLSVIVRGLRAVSDFEFEFQLANMSRHLTPENRIGVLNSPRAIHVHILDTGSPDRGAGRQCFGVRPSGSPRSSSSGIASFESALTTAVAVLSVSLCFADETLPARPPQAVTVAFALAGRSQGRDRECLPLASERDKRFWQPAATHSMLPWLCRRHWRWVEPSSSGLGGGGFYLLHRQSDGLETMVDAREKAPGAATRDMYLDKHGNEIPNASMSGPLSAGIPGEPAAFDYLVRKYGKLPLKKAWRRRFVWRGKAIPCMRVCKEASATRRTSWRARRKPRERS